MFFFQKIQTHTHKTQSATPHSFDYTVSVQIHFIFNDFSLYIALFLLYCLREMDTGIHYTSSKWLKEETKIVAPICTKSKHHKHKTIILNKTLAFHSFLLLVNLFSFFSFLIQMWIIIEFLNSQLHLWIYDFSLAQWRQTDSDSHYAIKINEIKLKKKIENRLWVTIYRFLSLNAKTLAAWLNFKPFHPTTVFVSVFMQLFKLILIWTALF